MVTEKEDVMILSSLSTGIREQNRIIIFLGVMVMAVMLVFTSKVTAVEEGGEPSIITLNPYWKALRSITVTLNGQEMEFLFDTGGGLGLITPQAVKIVGCEPFGKIIGHRHNGEVFEMPRCAGTVLQIGDANYEGETGVFDLMALLKGLPELGGIISLREFDGEYLTLDIGHYQLIVETEYSFKERIANMSEINLRASRSATGNTLDVFVAVEAPGGPLWMELDSGNAAATALAPHAVEQLNLHLKDNENKLTELSIIGFGPIETTITSREMIYDGLLNAALLLNHTMVLDLKNMRAWIALN